MSEISIDDNKSIKTQLTNKVSKAGLKLERVLKLERKLPI
jgi:hypothetical protein